MPILKTIAVLANPYVFVDHEGEPAGTCPCDPIDHTPARAWVGAQIDLERTKVLAVFPAGELRDNPQRTFWKFDESVITLPCTNYYLQRIQHGDLIAADERTHSAAFGGGSTFRDPAAVLAEKRAKAFDDSRAMFGIEPAFARTAAPAKKAASAAGDNK